VALYGIYSLESHSHGIKTLASEAGGRKVMPVVSLGGNWIRSEWGVG
jgi:hypothetical protein